LKIYDLNINASLDAATSTVFQELFGPSPDTKEEFGSFSLSGEIHPALDEEANLGACRMLMGGLRDLEIVFLVREDLGVIQTIILLA
jgi:hypothetical protein